MDNYNFSISRNRSEALKYIRLDSKLKPPVNVTNNDLQNSTSYNVQGDMNANMQGNQNQNVHNNRNAYKQNRYATMNRDEFHPESAQYGSTGDYSDMKGGAHFDQYDCGHAYDDSVVRNNNSNDKNEVIDRVRNVLSSTDDLKTSIIVNEVLKRRSYRERSRRF